ncbi:hypothetical protein D4740_07805 [Actinomyces sp. 2119]|uniref:hypothetical protein n=1 Tax=Actinomyces sp. 2119 TaxID=2321393 RepID=UPI000E6C3EF5|nr:hypothetical protein [Actinomyces sp. 2119]RJF41955.1 hypothetical protein D4740_07805 [Actinomyces sp. 2119]
MTQSRYAPRHINRFRRPLLRTTNAAAVVVGACVLVAVLPLLGWPRPATALVGLVALGTTLGLVTAPPTSALKWGVLPHGGRRGWAVTMVLAMSPAILLGLAFPVVAGRVSAHSAGGVNLQVIILSVSVAVPWLSQVTGNPVYRLLGDSIGRGPAALLRRYCSVWPALFAWALVPTLAVVLVMAAVTRWQPAAVAVHLVLLLLHVVFVQSLIVADVAGRRRLWAFGWLCYAAALLAAPGWWFLPPLAGTLSQVVPMGAALRQLVRPSPVPAVPLLQDMARGMVLGGVLWSDKFFLFLAVRQDFEVALVYLCLQPAVVAYCYYFAVTSPRLNTEIALFQAQLNEDDMTGLRARGKVLRHLLDASLVRAGSVGAGAVVVEVTVVALLDPARVPLVLAVASSSLLFTVLTLLSYEIDHIGDQASALLLSGAHVAAAAGLLLHLGGTGAYQVLVGVDLVLCLVALVVYRRRWASPEYSFFWGKAMSW